MLLAKVRIMTKVSPKLQVTVPKAIAIRYGIRPGDEIEWVAAGDSIRVLTKRVENDNKTCEERLELFDRATDRQRRRESALGKIAEANDRGWRREDLYTRGKSD